jgi:hypothetical protein
MAEKTKKILMLAVGCVLCAGVTAGIGLRFNSSKQVPSVAVLDTSQDSSAPTVSIDDTAQSESPAVSIGLSDSTTDPGAEANSTGTEQTIQADPVKPTAPDAPTPPTSAGQGGQDHTAEDVPQSERNTEQPPTYQESTTVKPSTNEPAPGSTNSAGQVYVPGFGYVEHSGSNTVIQADDMYENGNKIGIMGGD